MNNDNKNNIAMSCSSMTPRSFNIIVIKKDSALAQSVVTVLTVMTDHLPSATHKVIYEMDRTSSTYPL